LRRLCRREWNELALALSRKSTLAAARQTRAFGEFPCHRGELRTAKVAERRSDRFAVLLEASCDVS
jgi:hypothetical protein